MEALDPYQSVCLCLNYRQKVNRLNRFILVLTPFSDKDKEKKGDSFAEKLATNIVKNLQVTIKNIHIRYEDFYTTPDTPYAVGITLDSLYFQVGALSLGFYLAV